MSHLAGTFQYLEGKPMKTQEIHHIANVGGEANKTLVVCFQSTSDGTAPPNRLFKQTGSAENAGMKEQVKGCMCLGDVALTAQSVVASLPY